MCLLQAQAPRWEVRMCLLQAQAPCNEIIGGWACRSHCVWNICVYFNNTKFTEILWNDGVFEFPKEHQRCSRKHTDFNTIEIMCLRQAQAPCNEIIGGWACRSHCVIKELVIELVEATILKNSFFIFNFLCKWSSSKAIEWWERGNVLGLPTQKPLQKSDKNFFSFFKYSL